MTCYVPSRSKSKFLRAQSQRGSSKILRPPDFLTPPLPPALDELSNPDDTPKDEILPQREYLLLTNISPEGCVVPFCIVAHVLTLVNIFGRRGWERILMHVALSRFNMSRYGAICNLRTRLKHISRIVCQSHFQKLVTFQSVGRRRARVGVGTQVWAGWAGQARLASRASQVGRAELVWSFCSGGECHCN